MKKRLFLLPLLLIPMFVFSCNTVKNGTISVDKTTINLVPGEQAIIKYKTTNGQSAFGVSSNADAVGVFNNTAYMQYNGYVWLYANNELGNSKITLTANKCPSITVDVNVADDENYEFINEDLTIATAVPKIEKAVVEGHKTVFVKSISDLTNLKNLANYSELHNSRYDLTGWGTTAEGYKGFVFSYYDLDSINSTNINNDNVNIKNANLYLRQLNKTKYNKNTDSLPIDSVADTIDVSNTDQLWWVLEHGYKPTFSSQNTTAEQCYKKARDICFEVMRKEFNKLEIARTIFDYMTETMKYNHWAASGMSSNDDWRKYTDYYVEGPLLRNVGVCDGFSKTVAMLGGIMGLNTISKQNLIRSFGYADAGGHAWNYYCPEGSNNYYLVCPTWGQDKISNAFKDDNNITYPAIISNYSSFMTAKNYFKDYGGSKCDFTDYPWNGITKSINYYSQPTEYDNVTTSTPLTSLVNKCKQIKGDYVLNMTTLSNLENVKKHIIEAFKTQSISVKINTTEISSYGNFRNIIVLVDQ